MSPFCTEPTVTSRVPHPSRGSGFPPGSGEGSLKELTVHGGLKTKRPFAHPGAQLPHSQQAGVGSARAYRRMDKQNSVPPTAGCAQRSKGRKS